MKRKGWFLSAAACCALALICCTITAFAEFHGEAPMPEVHIPGEEEILEYGYPVNQKGQCISFCRSAKKQVIKCV
ncbi:MAG: hypothetical protein K2P49_06475 [Oscillospiraceae bacterium]|nr:hypothetical protein [Oscillospiraceae bacterium]